MHWKQQNVIFEWIFKTRILCNEAMEEIKPVVVENYEFDVPEQWSIQIFGFYTCQVSNVRR